MADRINHGEHIAASCYCGDLSWTITEYGRITHKEGCPARTDPWHQGNPNASAAEDQDVCEKHGLPFTEHKCLVPRPDLDAANPHTFGVLAIESGNFLDWLDTREDAEASAQQLRDLNPDMPADAVAVVEFDGRGMPV